MNWIVFLSSFILSLWLNTFVPFQSRTLSHVLHLGLRQGQLSLFKTQQLWNSRKMSSLNSNFRDSSRVSYFVIYIVRTQKNLSMFLELLVLIGGFFFSLSAALEADLFRVLVGDDLTKVRFSLQKDKWSGKYLVWKWKMWISMLRSVPRFQSSMAFVRILWEQFVSAWALSSSGKEIESLDLETWSEKCTFTSFSHLMYHFSLP